MENNFLGQSGTRMALAEPGCGRRSRSGKEGYGGCAAHDTSSGYCNAVKQACPRKDIVQYKLETMRQLACDRRPGVHRTVRAVRYVLTPQAFPARRLESRRTAHLVRNVAAIQSGQEEPLPGDGIEASLSLLLLEFFLKLGELESGNLLFLIEHLCDTLHFLNLQCVSAMSRTNQADALT